MNTSIGDSRVGVTVAVVVIVVVVVAVGKSEGLTRGALLDVELGLTEEDGLAGVGR